MGHTLLRRYSSWISGILVTSSVWMICACFELSKASGKAFVILESGSRVGKNDGTMMPSSIAPLPIRSSISTFLPSASDQKMRILILPPLRFSISSTNHWSI